MNTLRKFTIGLAIGSIAISCKNGNNSTDKKDSTKPAAVVKAKPMDPIKYDSSKRYIFLTWDDSPQPPGTTNCKKIFHEEGVKATFFSVGFNQVGPVKKRLIDQIRDGYPEFLLANHSFSHGFNDKYASFYSTQNTDSAYNDFMHNEKELGIGVKIIRLPGNNTWASNGKIHGQKANNPLIKKLDASGYKIIGWDMEWGQEGKKKAPKESVTQLVNMINQKFEDQTTNEVNMLVILSHDRLFGEAQYADSLRKFIQVLKKDPKNVFETIDHYPTVQNK
jgi:peptidoglycan/xylan/chitin deacetylase (PgdA/CDA1 family)